MYHRYVYVFINIYQCINSTFNLYNAWGNTFNTSTRSLTKCCLIILKNKLLQKFLPSSVIIACCIIDHQETAKWRWIICSLLVIITFQNQANWNLKGRETDKKQDLYFRDEKLSISISLLEIYKQHWPHKTELHLIYFRIKFITWFSNSTIWLKLIQVSMTL